ncbi:MAG: alpha/beta hydrolase-fold protein [Archangium sp.]|nr:alpha/beta hydrolase-fold protein [Archangium sp.]MDP3154171.1 alpha/beta hydrolase-fold protein [Archangium sp.]MDP3569510.1 alpha/beta hydrolase-fold protein [Archangium sp.]
MRILFAAALVLNLSCAKSVAVTPVDAGTERMFGGSRPVKVSVPKNYAGRATPLLLALHGYGNSGKPFESYLGLPSLVESEGIILVSPDGTVDAKGQRFWNAGSDACCNFGGSAVDDVKYLRELLAELRGVYNVDPRRIFVVGHSNGGFMAYRLACELSGELAAIMSLAGATPNCHPTSPVSVLQIHGDRDVGVRYEGGTNILKKGGGDYFGALESVERWALDDGCKPYAPAPPRREGAPIDLEAGLPGAETMVEDFDGCPAGVGVSLWTMREGRHNPEFTNAFAGHVWSWLEAHARP